MQAIFFAVASGNPQRISDTLNKLDNEINFWAKERGAVILAEKSDILHVCRKINCSEDYVCIRGINIIIAKEIIGLLFSKSLLWNIILIS